jgi:pyruvate/2-oxoacid:ferredoxin oxidoreductase beta subunit
MSYEVVRQELPLFEGDGRDLAKMMGEGHPHCYVATTTVGYPVDLMNKTRKGLNHRGVAFLHCYTPCQKGWVCQTSMTIELGRRVVESGLWPIWEHQRLHDEEYSMPLNRGAGA